MLIPNSATGKCLWRELVRLGDTMQDAWVVGGDFNATVLSCERKSIATSVAPCDRDFGTWVEEASLYDLGYVGPRFTWKQGSSEAHLDRFVANDLWMQRFPDARAVHLPNFKSDHRHVLLKFSEETVSHKGGRPFRFIASRVLLDNFKELVQENWNMQWGWRENLNHLVDSCKEWNKNIFGYTEARKKRLLRRLDGVTCALTYGKDVDFFENSQLQLWKELEDVISQDSLLWAQKARLKMACLWRQEHSIFSFSCKPKAQHQ